MAAQIHVLVFNRDAWSAAKVFNETHPTLVPHVVSVTEQNGRTSFIMRTDDDALGIEMARICNAQYESATGRGIFSGFDDLIDKFKTKAG